MMKEESKTVGNGGTCDQTFTVWDYFSTSEEVYSQFIAPVEGYILARVSGLLTARFGSGEIMGLKQDIFQEAIIALYVFVTEKHAFVEEKWQVSMSIINRIIIDSLRVVVGNRDANGRIRGNQVFFEMNNSVTTTNIGSKVSVLAEKPVGVSSIERLAEVVSELLGETVSALEVEEVSYARYEKKNPLIWEYSKAKAITDTLKELGKESLWALIYEPLDDKDSRFEVVTG